MTTFTLGDRVLVRAKAGAREHLAEVIDDRGDKVRVRLVLEDGSLGSARMLFDKERVRPVPESRVAPIIPPALRDRVEAIHAAHPPRPLRAVPKPPKRWRSEAYLRFVRQHPCCIAEDGATQTSCSGSVVAHHHGPRGTGEKTDDSRTVPLCDWHHRAFHDRGTIDEWSRDALDRAFTRVQSELLVAWSHLTIGSTGTYPVIIDAITARLREAS